MGKASYTPPRNTDTGNKTSGGQIERMTGIMKPGKEIGKKEEQYHENFAVLRLDAPESRVCQIKKDQKGKKPEPSPKRACVGNMKPVQDSCEACHVYKGLPGPDVWFALKNKHQEQKTVDRQQFNTQSVKFIFLECFNIQMVFIFQMGKITR